MFTDKRVLVVAAHPDDEVLGCGATISKYIHHGSEVCVLILGEGITSRQTTNSSTIANELENLQTNSVKANQILGVSKLIHERFPDNQFDSVPLLRIIQSIESVVSQFKPQIVFTHHSADLNMDHRIACDAVKTACRPLQGSCVSEIYTFEVPSSSEWRFDPAQLFVPNVFVDIFESLEKKVQAIRAYEGEVRAFPHPRSPEYIRALAQVRGGQSGLMAAEAFCLVRRSM